MMQYTARKDTPRVEGHMAKKKRSPLTPRDIEQSLKEMHDAGHDTKNVTVYLTKAGKKTVDDWFWPGNPNVRTPAVSTKQIETRFGTIALAVLDDDGFVVVPA